MLASSFSVIQDIAEHRIREAMEEGQLENLPGQGQPLQLENDLHVPQEMRMAYKILKNSGYIPPEIEQEKEIQNMLDLLEHCQDEQERYRQIQKLNVLIAKINATRRVPLDLEKNQEYYQKVIERVRVYCREKYRL